MRRDGDKLKGLTYSRAIDKSSTRGPKDQIGINGIICILIEHLKVVTGRHQYKWIAHLFNSCRLENKNWTAEIIKKRFGRHKNKDFYGYYVSLYPSLYGKRLALRNFVEAIYKNQNIDY